MSLRALVIQAFELRDSPYFRDAVDALIERYERKPLSDLERQMERDAHIAGVVRLLRETDPSRSVTNLRAAA